MNSVAKIVAAVAVLAAGLAAAQEGAQNPAVKARQAAMQSLAGGAKVLGEMAGDKVPFDAAAAEAARAQIVAAVTLVPVLFEPQETDPKSRARPEIWAGWDDFVAKAGALKAAAEAVDTTSLDGIRAGMAAVGGACQSCHTAYRTN